MLRLHGAQVDMDLVTISNELDKAGKLADIGGPAYLIQLVNDSPIIPAL